MSQEKGVWKETDEPFVSSRSLCTFVGRLSGYRKINRWTQLRIMSYNHLSRLPLLGRNSRLNVGSVQKHPDAIKNFVIQEKKIQRRFPLLRTWQTSTRTFPLAAIEASSLNLIEKCELHHSAMYIDITRLFITNYL